MRKNGFVVMWQLMKLVTPLAHIMSFTIIMGTLGFLSAIFIMVLGAMGLSELLNFHSHLNLSQILTALIVLAVARGILRYLEQMSGHYIAFKLLALLRDKVFCALRRLAFVKLQDKQSGQLLVRAYFLVVRVGGIFSICYRRYYFAYRHHPNGA